MSKKWFSVLGLFGFVISSVGFFVLCCVILLLLLSTCYLVIFYCAAGQVGYLKKVWNGLDTRIPSLVRAWSGGIIFVTCPAISCFVEHTSSHEIVVKTFIAVLLEHIMFFKSWLRTDLENQWKVSALKGFCLHLSVGHGGRKKSPEDKKSCCTRRDVWTFI